MSGGIACYKSCILARRLTEAGARVDVVLTRGAAEFVRPRDVRGAHRAPRPDLPVGAGTGRSRTSACGQDADLVIVAPATAHLIARMAQGLADDVLTSLLLARTAPVLARAGDERRDVRRSPQTQANLERLARRGASRSSVRRSARSPEGPSERPGRMSEPETILAHAARLLRGSGAARAAAGSW